MKFLIAILFTVSLTFSFAQTEKKISIFFDFNSVEIKPNSADALNELLVKLGEKSAQIVDIEAFADTVGSVAYNIKLARKRANEVIKHLQISNKSVTTKVFGENYWIKDSYIDSFYRRVDIRYTELEEEIVEVAPIIVQEEVDTASIVSKFVSFASDSTITEMMIELSILFVPGEAILLPESNQEMWDLFEFMKYNPSITAFIRGHVCCADDFSLSTERAYVVYTFLAQRAISHERLSYKGYSNTIPAVSPEITDLDRKRNRRVDIIFTKG